jgi:hypothetical protein
VEYGNNPLENQLSVVARLIKGGLSTKLYMVSLDGFDTHAGQNEIQPYLLHVLSTAIDHFFKDLKKSGDDKRALAITFSEFGRRIEQNASQGTDHGAAAPVMMFGPGLEGNGFLGKAPDLQDLDVIGNLKFDIDFRQIYASILENWLCIEKNQVDIIMGKSFESLPNMGFQCSPITSIRQNKLPSIPFQVISMGSQIQIQYELPKAMRVSIQLYNLSGQMISQLVNAHQLSGKHQVNFYPQKLNMIPGQYVCTLQSGPHKISRQISYY